MLPIFGGLTAFLSKVVPGVDFVLGQNDFSADFELRDRSILSEHVAVEGGVFSLQGKGVCGFDGNLNYAVQVKLMREHPLFAKLIRLITWPLSKLFEFRLSGTVAKPEWYPINFSRELLENLGLKGERPPTPPADGADHADAK
jgi:hypothetical protein